MCVKKLISEVNLIGQFYNVCFKQTEEKKSHVDLIFCLFSFIII